MAIRKDLFSAIGLSEYSPIKSLVVVIMFLSGIGIFSDSIVDLVDGQKYTKLMISIVIFFIVFIIYKYLGKKEMQLTEIRSEGKQKMILFFPSNLALLKKILHNHSIEELFFIKTKNFPSEREYSEITDHLKSKNIKFSFEIIENENNIREIKNAFLTISEKIVNQDLCVVNITPGKTLGSIVLYELAKYKRISVEYLNSQYNKYNMPIENTEMSYELQVEEVFIKWPTLNKHTKSKTLQNLTIL